jgi:DMSO/TMAO reductase YedYZ molybdopterin-dependent catalytic subunit
MGVPTVAHRRRGPAGLTARQVDVLLELLIGLAALSGLLSWLVGTPWSRVITAAHGIIGLTLILFLPAKARGSVRTGLRRGRPTRWLSVVLAGLVVATLVLGLLHSTGLWFGVGPWSALWTHVLAAVAVLVVTAWHVGSRPSRPRVTDLDRRAVLQATATLTAGAALYGLQEVAAPRLGLAGGSRRFTGSHEVGSFAPDRMPSVSWINDRAPATTSSGTWQLVIAGRPLSITQLREMARPVVATLDCTGGWFSAQSWDAITLSTVLDPGSGRSVRVRSSTGYDRRFPLRDLDHLHLAVGYGGEPLRPGHGAPVRLIAPGRRGPWWVKWVTDVDVDDRPWWWQLPLPLA